MGGEEKGKVGNWPEKGRWERGEKDWDRRDYRGK